MTNHNFTFHITTEGDAGDICEVETRAFGFSKEAELVADLLNDESACPRLSLLARHNGKAVGHILFTRATFKGDSDSPDDAYPCPSGGDTGIPGHGGWRMAYPKRY